MKKLLATAAMVLAASTAQAADDGFTAGSFVDSLSDFNAWKGSVEGGLAIFNGNTESTDLHGKFGVGHTYGKWTHALSGEALNREENAHRSAEKYRLGWHSDYKFTDRLFGFGEAEWTKDRFSGYDYRVHEDIGLGYIFLDNSTWFWDGRAGVGMQHTKDDQGNSEDAFLGKLGTKLVYNFNENVSFTQIGEALFTAELETYRSESSVKSKISEHLAFKAGYIVEKLSAVPAGRKKTDSHTFLGVVYDF